MMTLSIAQHGMKWVRLNKYCELSGDTPDAVYARRRKGEWLNEVQCRLGPDQHLWINLPEVEKWIEHAHLTPAKPPRWQRASPHKR